MLSTDDRIRCCNICVTEESMSLGADTSTLGSIFSVHIWASKLLIYKKEKGDNTLIWSTLKVETY